MLRRPIIRPLVLVFVVLAAGCVGLVPGDLDATGTPTPAAPSPATPTPDTTTVPTATPEPTPETVTPQSFPWKPEPLRAANVEVYVREYERTVRHNDLVGPSVVGVEQTCHASLVAQVDSDYLVRAECGGSVHRRDDGTGSVGAVAPERVTYFVNDSTLERIAGADRRLDPYRAGDGGRNVGTAEGVAVINADDRRHELRVAVTYDGEASDESVLDEVVAVAPGEGVDLRRVAAREGVYNVTVTAGNETVARHRWRVVGDDTVRPGGIGVVVTPGDEVVVIALPRMQ